MKFGGGGPNTKPWWLLGAGLLLGTLFILSHFLLLPCFAECLFLDFCFPFCFVFFLFLFSILFSNEGYCLFTCEQHVRWLVMCSVLFLFWFGFGERGQVLEADSLSWYWWKYKENRNNAETLFTAVSHPEAELSLKCLQASQYKVATMSA